MAAQREWFDKDYYAVLGVPSSASEKELSRAYKKLAKQHHPDANQGASDSEERFKEVNEAYDVLGDAQKRTEYDEVRRMVASGAGPGSGGFGPGGFGPGGFGGQGYQFDVDFAQGGGFSDLLGNLIGNRGGRGRGRRNAHGPQRGQDLETELHLSFDDAVAGVTSTVRFRADATCSTCNGSGAAPGTSPETCPQCQGMGSIADNQGPFSFSQVCPTCGGRGQVIPTPCPTCHGRGVEVRPREVKVRVPAGVTDGQRIRVKSRGAAGINGGAPGDLFVVVGVQPHPLFGRNGNDITIRVPVSFPEVALGADVKVPTLDGQVTVRIPPGTPSGKVLHVRGKGVPADGKHNGRHAGDLLATIDVQVPTELDDGQRAAVEALAEALAADPRAELFEKQQPRRSTMDDSRALYVISVAAELAGVHPQTLRIYERKGLVPARTSGRSRRYSERDIELLRRIQELTNDGISLVGVQRILALEQELSAARARATHLESTVDALHHEIEERVAEAHRQYKREIVPLRSRALVRTRDLPDRNFPDRGFKARN